MRNHLVLEVKKGGSGQRQSRRITTHEPFGVPIRVKDVVNNERRMLFMPIGRENIKTRHGDESTTDFKVEIESDSVVSC